MDDLGVWSGLKQGNRRTSTAPMGAQLTGVISSFRAVAADSITVKKATTSWMLLDTQAGCILFLVMEFALNRLRG